MRLARLSWIVVVAACGHAAAPAAHPEHHWGYAGAEGPAAWGMLSDHYRACATGRKQSPIDLDPSRAGELPALALHYTPTTVLELDNGHTIQEQVPPGEIVEHGGTRYELQQFHFHHPSEHTFAGRHFPLEIHFVHRSDKGKLLVVGVMVEQGADNDALRMLFDRLPHGADQIKVALDPAALLPRDLRHVTYDGSLTTPPCSEGVTWVVLATPISATKDELERFAAVFPNNSRPVIER